MLILTALAAAYVCYGIYSDTFRIWDTRVVDRLVLWRAKAGALPPGVADAVVHVDANSYFSRSQHAKVIENLTAMNVSVQLVDFLFADVTSQNEDQQLVEASRQAGNVFYGLRFESLTEQKTNNNPSSAADRTSPSGAAQWPAVIDGNPDSLYSGAELHQPYPELVAAARGIGFLNLTPDPDGIIRRLPLLASYRGTYYPSIALAAICDYFNVAPQNVIVKPGKSLTLKEARRGSGTSPHDIVIPIDRSGSMLLDGTNYWNAVRHYSSGEIFRASENPARLAELKKGAFGQDRRPIGNSGKRL